MPKIRSLASADGGLRPPAVGKPSTDSASGKLLALPEVMEMLEQRVALDYPELAHGRTHLPMCLVVTQTREVLGLLVSESPEEEADYCAAAATLLLAKRPSSTSSPTGGRPHDEG